MFLRKLSHILPVLALGGMLSLNVACDSGDKKDGDKTDAKADGGDQKAAGDDGGGAEPAGDGPAEVSLDQVGLKATAPAGATVGDGIGGGVMVTAPGLVVSVSEAKDDSLDTADKAKEDADMYTPENWKSEDVDGGYVATFENKGGAGVNYWVKSYRKIGEKAYLCDTTASQPEQQANAVAFCKSLAAK